MTIEDKKTGWFSNEIIETPHWKLTLGFILMWMIGFLTALFCVKF